MFIGMRMKIFIIFTAFVLGSFVYGEDYRDRELSQVSSISELVFMKGVLYGLQASQFALDAIDEIDDERHTKWVHAQIEKIVSALNEEDLNEFFKLLKAEELKQDDSIADEYANFMSLVNAANSVKKSAKTFP